MTSSFHSQNIPLFDGRLDLIKAVLSRINPEWRRGLRMSLQSDAPPGSGLGASSALVVASILSIARLLGVLVSPREVAELAYQIERADLGIMGGYQDQYAAAFGGFNWTEYTSDGVYVTPLGVSSETLLELEYRCLLWYTGATHVSGGILKEQVSNYTAEDENVLHRLQQLKDLTAQMRKHLLRGELDDFGELLGYSWTLKKGLANSISTTTIDEMYAAALTAGALGGKVLGAGGGGYLLLYTPADRQAEVMSSLEKVGGHFGGALHFNLTGPTTWASRELVTSADAFRMA